MGDAHFLVLKILYILYYIIKIYETQENFTKKYEKFINEFLCRIYLQTEAALTEFGLTNSLKAV